ncbi:hypothetical protein ABPG75_009551 [Micractinium tetrahymenae]
MPAPWPLPSRHSTAPEEAPASTTCSSEAKEQQHEQGGQAPSTLQTVLACREFSAAFGAALQSGATRAAATQPVNPARLAERFQAIDIEAVLHEENAARVLSEAYGMESWLVGPERGVRALVARCLLLYREPMENCLGSVKQALLAAADAALLSLPDGLDGSSSSDAAAAEQGCPAWLRQALLGRAQSCIKSWHADTQRQLSALLEAESLCPAPERFEQLRLKLAGLLQAAQSAEAGGAGTPEAMTELGGKQPPAAASAQASPDLADEGTSREASWLMGSLLKMSRHGRWQRRFFMLPQGKPVLYYAKSAKADSRTALDLAGAAVVEGVLLLAQSSSPGTADDSLAFHLQLAAPAAAGARRQRAILTVRAPSAGAKEAWVRELRAAAAGSKHAKQASPAALADGPAVPAALVRTVSNCSSDSGAVQQPTGASSAGGVPRKISTQVFADPAPSGSSTVAAAQSSSDSTDAGADDTAAIHGQDGGLDASAAGMDGEAAQRAAHEADLLAAIDRLAAQRQPSPEEAAVAAAVAEAARGYVHEARGRLLALTQRVVSAGMLLEREEAMGRALLDVLLPAGSRPTWVDAE